MLSPATAPLAPANMGVEAVQPFYAEAKLPLEVTAGDQILLPISLINATASKLAGRERECDLNGDFKLPALLKGSAEIGAGERVRWIQPIDVGFGNGLKDFVLTAKAGLYEDKVTRKLSVKPKGFPIETAFGGILEPGKPAIHTITIPKGVVPGKPGLEHGCLSDAAGESDRGAAANDPGPLWMLRADFFDQLPADDGSTVFPFAHGS